MLCDMRNLYLEIIRPMANSDFYWNGWPTISSNYGELRKFVGAAGGGSLRNPAGGPT